MSDDSLLIPVEVPGGGPALALLERIAVATENVGGTTTKTTEAVQSSAVTWDRLAGGIDHATNIAQEMGAKFIELRDKIAELASEQEHLDAMSRQLGLDFDGAAASAGRFADETDALHSASEFAARGVQLTQTELNNLMRVAGATAQTLGTDTQTQINALTEALIRGRARGLAPFGETMAEAAGPTHTLQDRLNALAERAGQVHTATDNATTSIARFRDQMNDLQRAGATAFLQELHNIEAMHTHTDAMRTDADELKRTVEGVGASIAFVMSQVVHLGEAAVGALRVAFGDIRGGARQVATAVNQSAEEVFQGYGLNGGRRTIATPDERASRRERQDAFDARGNGWGGSAGEAARRANVRPDARGQTDVESEGGETTAPADGGIFARLRAERERNEAQAQAQARRRGGGGGHDDQRQSRTNAQRMVAEMSEETTATQHFVEDQRRREEAAQRYTHSLELDAGRRELAANQARTHAQLETRFEIAQNNQRLASQHSYTDRLQALYQTQQTGAQSLAENTRGAFGDIGSAIEKHVNALVTGRESAGAAMRGMAGDAISAIGARAEAEGGFYAVKAIADVVTPGMEEFVPLDIAASIGFLALGASLMAGGAALGGGGTGGGGAPTPAASAATPGRASPVTSTAGGSQPQGGGATVVNNYYAPQFGGRQGTMAEVGTRMNRYTNVEAARTTRAA